MKRPLVIAAATVGVLGTAAFALPNLPPNALTDVVNERVFDEKDRSYRSAADTAALPAWVPGDARNVRFKVKTTGRAKLLRFTVGASGWEGPRCSGTPARVDAPELDARWWAPGRTGRADPADRADQAVQARAECRDAEQYRVVVRGKRVYAWTNGEPSPAGRGTR
ncbi:hypothetical protein [Streptomyces sp. NPDC012888]|uniref:hypothetical protein n=1 Tax=Streptomyces sp. NPDC012888 TaxID=3364855 RepID=UPI0036C2C704